MHEARVRRHGDPSKVIGQSEIARLRGPDNPMWQESPSYSAWHQRLNKAKGPASQHQCSQGCGSEASQWAYVGDRDPEERMPFETDLTKYEPMCVPCHKSRDLSRMTPPDLWRNRDRDVEWHAEAAQMRSRGLTFAEIGAAVGRHPTTVLRAVRRLTDRRAM